MDVLSDRYELRGVLGTGGMAEVREAHDRVLDRRVAVKLLRPDLARDPSVRERFLREARHAARFNHGNAVAVYDTGVQDGQPFIVMELVDGGTLADYLRERGQLDVTEATDIADAVLAALAAAHAVGLVHRDIKPGNVLLPREGGVRLADFGIAKGVQEATAGLTATGQVIGTAAYLSPEQVEGHPATPASDVYGMGIVLYEMLTGSPPFSGGTPLAIALAHTTRPVPSLRAARPDVPPELAGVVERALAKDPAARYPDAEALRRALRGEPGAAHTPTVVLPPRRETERAVTRSRRRRSPWPWLALVTVAVVGLLAFAAARLDPAGDPGPRAQATEEPAEPTEEPAEPTEEPAASEEPQTEPTEPEPEPESPDQPEDLPQLLELLIGNPEAYGSKQGELQKDLVKVLSAETPEARAEEAQKLSDHAIEWAGKGELDPDLAAVVVELLQPLTVVPEATAAPPESDEGGDPPGKAKGKKPKD